MTTTSPTRVAEPDVTVASDTEHAWVVVVWDDPVNLMDYVVFVFRELFGFSKRKATKLMLRVHNEGRAAVFTGPREEAELHVQRLHAYGLWATMER